MVIAFIRTLLLYFLLIFGIRLLGKRQVGELEPSELVLALLAADLAAVPMQDFGIPLLFGMIPIVVLLAVTMILSVLTMKSLRFRTLVCGSPSLIVNNGKLCQQEMERNRFTVDELLEELRMKGITDLATVQYAILETSGQLSVLPFSDQLPVTAGQLAVAIADGGLPTVIINDGHIMKQNLLSCGLSENWLQQKLAEYKLSDPSQVFLLTVDRRKKVYLSAKECAS